MEVSKLYTYQEFACKNLKLFYVYLTILSIFLILKKLLPSMCILDRRKNVLLSGRTRFLNCLLFIR